MIPDFADEAINKKIAKMKLAGAGRAEYIVASGIRLIIYVLGDIIELSFWDIKGKFAVASHYFDEGPSRYATVDVHHYVLTSSAGLMEYLMSLSDELGEWLLWNRIL